MKRYLGVAALVVSAAGLATSFVMTGGDSIEFRQDPTGEILMILAFLAFPIVGSVIVWRQPNNPIGWVFAAIGVLVGVGPVAEAYAIDVLPGHGSPAMLGVAAAWFQNWWWYPMLGLIIIVTLSLFPTGRVLSSRWRIPFLVGAAGIVLVTFASMTSPRLVSTSEQGRVVYDVDNPIGIEWMFDPEEDAVGGFFFGVVTLGSIAAVLSLIVRFWRSRGMERQQLKLFAFGAVLVPLNIVGEGVLDELFGHTNAFFAIGVGALPVAAGIAILRYRLYDIDLVINRALVYGTLTAVLGGLYIGIVFGLQAVLSPITAQSDLAIAGSTLAVAGLFRPIRSRVQGFIDRRFYRRKFNAQRTVEEFSAHLRDEVELESVSGQLVDVVRTTMQPAHVSLWIPREVAR